MSENLSVRDVWSFLLPRLAENSVPPVWPPDMFALTMGLVARWGLYARALESWPPHSGTVDVEWADYVMKLGSTWGKRWSPDAIKSPDAFWDSDPSLRIIKQKWSDLLNLQERTASSSSNSIAAEEAARFLELAAIADEACCGFGIAFAQLQEASPNEYPDSIREFFYFAEKRLIKTRSDGASLCNEISPSRLRVLPKMHTPSSGLTVRSLSHYLAILEVCEIKPQWHIPDQDLGKDCLNLLFIPSPSLVVPADFHEVDRGDDAEMRNLPKKSFGFFTYEPKSAIEDPFVTHVQKLIEVAERTVGRIHTVLMPELALTPEQFRVLAASFIPAADPEDPPTEAKDYGDRAFVIAGVRSQEKRSKTQSATPPRGRNEVRFFYGRKRDPSDIRTQITQSKHHRWKLDSSQIKQYGLGSSLHPERDWWEHIGVSDRSLAFLALQPWLVLSVLICEDLARPDPVGDLIRAVGPNLVIALLMDGPQVKERWSARYATTLADDPGCSVLSITSIGMSNLSRPTSGTIPRNRVVGLWKSARLGTPIEIELPPTGEAIVLSLTKRFAKEWTADGRNDGAEQVTPS